MKKYIIPVIVALLILGAIYGQVREKEEKISEQNMRIFGTVSTLNIVTDVVDINCRMFDGNYFKLSAQVHPDFGIDDVLPLKSKMCEAVDAAYREMIEK